MVLTEFGAENLELQNPHTTTLIGDVVKDMLQEATIADTLPRCANVGETAGIVLKNMPPTAARPLRTLLPIPAATASASMLPGQCCALNEWPRPAEQPLPMQPSPAYT